MRTALVAAAMLIPAVAQAAMYTDETAFVNAMPAHYYMEHFPDYTLRQIPPSGALVLDYGPVNGYSFQATSPGPSGDNWLYTNPHGLSIEDARDQMKITFTGAPTYWAGGMFYACDRNGNVIPTAQGTVTFSTGDTVSFTGSAFVGLNSSTPIQWLQVDALDIVPDDPWQGTYYWPAADNIYAGATNVPEPVALGLLPLVGLVLSRRR